MSPQWYIIEGSSTAAKTMGYAILRVQKLKSGQAVRRSLVHAFREKETPNADASRTPDNTNIGATNSGEALQRFNGRLATQTKVRKNAVLAIEYLVTASPDDMRGKSREQQDAYFRDALDWLRQRHGAENVVHAGVHRDETTPHMYAYVVPIDQRGKLNCRAFLGGAKALADMQTDFAAKVGQVHELDRGLHGSKARHTTIKQYYARVNRPVPDVRVEITPPDFSSRIDPREYGKKVAKSVVSQLKPTVDALRAKASEASAAARRAAEMEKTAKASQEREKGLTRRLGELYDIAKLFTPDDVKAARERKRRELAEKEQAEAEAKRQKARELARTIEVQALAEARLRKLREQEAPAPAPRRERDDGPSLG